jgi:hypothetical protein
MATLVLAGATASGASAESRVIGWGANTWGTLGNGGEPFFSDVPVATEGLTGVKQIAAGGSHALALLEDGTVAGWGTQGTGDGLTDVPVAVAGLSAVKTIAAGSDSSLALLEDGTVMAWGDNLSGQLGTGSKATSDEEPEPVSGLTGVRAIAAGVKSGLALLEGGTAWAWGVAIALGGDTEAPGGSRVPVQVHDLSGVRAIAAGNEFDLALLEGGGVDAWGVDQGVGDGTREDKTLPTAVCGASGITTIAAGGVGLYADGYAYGPAGPLCAEVTGLGPFHGIEGGSVTIGGSNLTEVTAVHFGGTSASFTSESPTSIRAVAPLGSGTVPVTVTTAPNTRIDARNGRWEADVQSRERNRGLHRAENAG